MHLTALPKPTVLIAIGHYLPGVKVGGPLTSVKNIVDNLHPYFDFKILTTNADFGDSTPYPGIVPNTWLPFENCEILYVDVARLRIPQVWKAIRGTAADVLYLNPLLDPVFSGSIVLLKQLGFLNKTQVVVCPRGELFDEALAFKSTKKKCFLFAAKMIGLYRNVRLHATNEKELQCIVERLSVRPEQVRLAHIISRHETTADTNVHTNFSSEAGSIKIVFMARISKDKNLEFVFDVFDRVAKDVSVDFDIFGPVEDEYIWKSCQERMKRLPPNIRVQYKGIVEKKYARQKLAEYDLFFMPTFAENYGHAIAESLSMGTPVLISDNTPWRNLVELGLGWDINLSAVGEFVSAIEAVAATPKSERANKRVQIQDKMISILNDPKIVDENISLFRF